jgi:para-aminobenzoate synthetase/4-amino-4-deoxychorismate lyase
LLIFDFPAPDGTPRRLTFDAPLEVLIARDVSEVRAVLRAVEAATRRGLYAAGFVSYEAAPAFDPAHAVHASTTLPLAWFGVYASAVDAGLAARPSPRSSPSNSSSPARPARPSEPSSPSAVRATEPIETERIETEPTEADAGALLDSAWQPAIDREAYDVAVARIRDAIAEGDVYQVNYTFPLRAPLSPLSQLPPQSPAPPVQPLPPLPPRTEAEAGRDDKHRALYERLARGGHGRYGAYLDIHTHRLLSFSPELFFSRTGDRLVCRPMKGTIARGRWPEEDAARAARLQSSPKDRAENVMIVDLVRNDLGRVAEIGSVRVASLCELERYPTVWQMTSTIEAQARLGTTLEDIFAALFPCGSVTGAPKISAMQRIADLESSARGVYCGAIGLAGPDGALFNVAIRTMTIDIAAGAAAYPVGGGVTWDSTARDEYAEALAKAALLRPAPPFALLETMRLDVLPQPRAEFARLERHLARLAGSARDRDIPVDIDAIRVRLLALAAAQPAGSWRVRLLVSRDGRAELDVQPAPRPLPASASALAATPALASAPPPAPASSSASTSAAASTSTPAPVVLAMTPVDEEDWFLYHKTTHRAVYEQHRAAAPPDAFDVLLWNRRGELTEFTIGNLVVSLDGQRCTPPRASGLLAGVFRAELLDRGEIAERVLTRDDLRRAGAIWLINSVREWVPVTLVDRPIN